MIDRSHKLSLSRRADLLGISRDYPYYAPRPVAEDDLRLMRRIDELHMDYPVCGQPYDEGALATGRLHRRASACGHLHETDGIQALYCRQNTSKPALGHKGLSVFASKACGDAAEKGLCHGHYLHPDGAWLSLPRRRAGLVV